MNAGISSGSSCRSASIVNTMSPFASLKPAIIAADLPKLVRSSTALTPGFSDASRAISAVVPSVEPSSTRTISHHGQSMPASTPTIASTRIGRLCDLVVGRDDDRQRRCGPHGICAFCAVEPFLQHEQRPDLLVVIVPVREVLVQKPRDVLLAEDPLPREDTARPGIPGSPPSARS